jgi:hypothetical protein
MPTIIRPNRSRPPPPAMKSSTHLKVLEKITSSIVPSAPRSSSPYLADLLDLDVTVADIEDDDDSHSPPEPCIPPPAPPSFLLAASSINAVAATLTSSSPPPSLELGLGPDVRSAVALFDYQSSHPGDLNFKVHTHTQRERERERQIPRVCSHPETCVSQMNLTRVPKEGTKLGETL